MQLLSPIARLLATVLADMKGSGILRPQIEYRSWSRTPGQVTAVLRDSDGSEAGVFVMDGWDEAEQLASLAGQVQEWYIEARWKRGMSTSWPECPEHPATHPLTAMVSNEHAVWACPLSQDKIADIGNLAENLNELYSLEYSAFAGE